MMKLHYCHNILLEYKYRQILVVCILFNYFLAITKLLDSDYLETNVNHRKHDSDNGTQTYQDQLVLKFSVPVCIYIHHIEFARNNIQHTKLTRMLAEFYTSVNTCMFLVLFSKRNNKPLRVNKTNIKLACRERQRNFNSTATGNSKQYINVSVVFANYVHSTTIN